MPTTRSRLGRRCPRPKRRPWGRRRRRQDKPPRSRGRRWRRAGLREWRWPGAWGRTLFHEAQPPSRSIQDLLRAGRFEAAIAVGERAVEQSPGDAEAWAALAAGLFAARRPEAALDAWDRVLALAPGGPDGLCGKGTVLQSLGW